MKFINRIQKFMKGRYGPDELYYFLFGIYIFTLIINIFIKSIWLRYFELLLVLITFYRFLSKNIYSRAKENNIYLKIKNKLLKPFINLKRNYRDRKTNVYKKCNRCKTTLKLPLPKKRGINHAVCPKCKKRIKLISFRKQKIEIIRDKRGRKYDKINKKFN